MQVQNPKQQQKPTSLCLSCLFSWKKNRQKKQISISSVLQIRYNNINKNSKKKKVGAKSITKRFKDVIEISLTMAKS
jgi:hypothetical protein